MKRITPLSRREAAVFSRMAKGQSTKIVAAELGISFRTVDTYRERILRKLHASNAAHAVHIGHMAGLL